MAAVPARAGPRRPVCLSHSLRSEPAGSLTVPSALLHPTPRPADTRRPLTTRVPLPRRGQEAKLWPSHRPLSRWLSPPLPCTAPPGLEGPQRPEATLPHPERPGVPCFLSEPRRPLNQGSACPPGLPLVVQARLPFKCKAPWSQGTPPDIPESPSAPPTGAQKASVPALCSHPVPAGDAATSTSEQRPQCPCRPLCWAPGPLSGPCPAATVPPRGPASHQRRPCVQGSRPPAGPSPASSEPSSGHVPRTRSPARPGPLRPRPVPVPAFTTSRRGRRLCDRVCIPSPAGPGAARDSNVPHGEH